MSVGDEKKDGVEWDWMSGEERGGEGDEVEKKNEEEEKRGRRKEKRRSE